jgi:plasmid maintenance system antidote protein VapI
MGQSWFAVGRGCDTARRRIGLSQYRLAKGLSVPPLRINEILLGKRSITADTALRPIRF